MSSYLTNDEIKNSPDYITKSKITRAECDKMGIPKNMPVSEVKDAFDDIEGRRVKTGNPYNENQQRHTKFVSKLALYRSIFKTDGS